MIIFDFLINAIQSKVVHAYLSIFIQFVCFVTKLVLLYYLYSRENLKKRGFLFLVILLLTGAYTDLAYIVRRFYGFPFYFIPEFIKNFILWLVNIATDIHFYILLLFFRDFSSRPIYSRFLKIIFPIAVAFFGYFLYRAFYFFCTQNIEYIDTDWMIVKWHTIYYLSLGFIAVWLLYRNYKIEKLKLLKYHILTLGIYFMIPYLIVRILDSHFVSPTVNLNTVIIFSVMLTFMLYYCLKRLMNFRFLNIRKHVEASASEKFDFLGDFMSVINSLAVVSKAGELIPITKKFFNKAFHIPEDKVHLFLRGSLIDEGKEYCIEQDSYRKLFIDKTFSSNTENIELVNYVYQNKILIKDEEEFSYFYEVSNHLIPEVNFKNGINFLHNIKAEIFVPIYKDKKMIGSIVIDFKSRENKLFTNVERDEMLIYADYLSSIIYLMTHVSLDKVLENERFAQKRAYSSTQRLTIFRKTLSNFVDTKSNKIGILTYKNKKFNYINQDAKDLLRIDLNKDKGLDITSNIVKVVTEAATFFVPAKKFVTGIKGESFVISAFPNLEKNNTVVTISSPNIADFMQEKIVNLKDQSKWEYALALMTTEEGALIEKLIPADTPTFLNCKISFLESIITSKNILLEISVEEDALAFAHVAHKLNSRSIFEEFIVDRIIEPEELGHKLFGINPILKNLDEDYHGLLEKLHKKGTLLIQNIHLLSLELQKKLLVFISTGKFSRMKSDELMESDIILICSSNQNLLDLVQKGSLLKDLYIELRKNSVWLPALTTVSEDEFLILAEGLRKQIVFSKLYQNLLTFNEADKHKLFISGCVSLHELRAKIKNIIIKKTQRHSLNNSNVIDPAYTISDLDLVEAARLGKHALKNPKTLSMLMTKFKNSQSKVALFLGVNRSSVSRRCTQYGIDDVLEEK